MVLTVQIAKRLPEFELDVSLEAGSEPVGILGPSGAGKSMLLHCIAGIERPDRGRISLGDRTLFDSERHIEVPARARRIGMLFQRDSLFPHRTVAENIGFGLDRLPVEERAKRVAAWMERTHIQRLEHRRPRELSGGNSSAPHLREPWPPSPRHYSSMNRSQLSTRTCAARSRRSCRRYLSNSAAPCSWSLTISKRPTGSAKS